MAICGNRHKVAAYRGRLRDQVGFEHRRHRE
jgi:predicted RNA-binding Zn ribbon-like protein